MTESRSIPNTAQRARAVALERHRAELEEVRSEADKKLALLNDMLASERDLKEEAARSTMIWKTICSLMAGFVLILCIKVAQPPEPWNTSTPPSRQKLEVVTYGWHDPKRGWCSYDNGEQITVKQWKP